MNNIKLFYFYTLSSSCIFDRGIFILFLLDRNFSNVQIGILQSVLFWSNFASEMPTGVFGDRWGRKISMFIGLFLLAISALGHIICHSFSAFLVIFAIQGLAFSFISGSDSALLYDSLKSVKREDEYIKIHAHLSALHSITLGLAMAIGGFSRQFSWDLVYALLTVMTSLGAITVLFMKEIVIEDDINNSREPNDSADHPRITKMFCDFLFTSHGKTFLTLVLAFSLFYGAVTPYFVFSQKLFSFYGLHAGSIGMIFGFVEISSGIVALLSEKVARLVSLRKMMPIVMITVSIMLASNAVNSLLLSVIIFFTIMVIPEVMEILVDNFFHMHLSSRIRATAISFISFVQSMVISLCYFIYGFMLDLFSPGTSIAITAIMPLVGGLLVIKFFPKKSEEI